MSRRTAPTSQDPKVQPPRLRFVDTLVRGIGWGLTLIVAIMPIHAFLSVWLGTSLGHQSVIQAWKELILLLLSAATLVLLFRSREHLKRLSSPWIFAACAYVAISLIVTFVTAPDFKLVVFGAKTNLEFVVAAIIAWIVATPVLVRHLQRAVLIGVSVVASFGVLQIYALPPDFLTRFGYGPDTIMPFQRIAEGTSTLRFPSTLGGPNQLGSYLILPLCLTIALAWRKANRWLLILTGAAILCLIGAHSRSAWAGALVAMSLAVVFGAPARIKRRVGYAVASVAVISTLAVPVIIATDSKLQYYVLHSSIENQDRSDLSNGQHVQSLEDGTSATIRQPFGHGLGSAGPATFQTDSPNIIENYYLQISYETGVFGLIAFLGLVAMLGRTLWGRRSEPLAQAAFLAILGTSIICLLLPAWTDSSTALIAWICAGAAANWTRPSETKHV